MFISGQVRPASIMKINSKNVVIGLITVAKVNQEWLNPDSNNKNLDVLICN